MNKNLSFNCFLKLKEADGNQQPTGAGFQVPVVAPESNLPTNQADASAGQSPPTTADKEGFGNRTQNRYVEKRTEAVSEKIDDLFEDLQNREDQQQAINILTSQLSKLANQYGLDTEVIKTNLNFQNEPKSRPLQPMADG